MTSAATTLTELSTLKAQIDTKIEAASLSIGNYLQYNKTLLKKKDKKFDADYNITLWIAIKERLDSLKETMEKKDKCEILLDEYMKQTEDDKTTRSKRPDPNVTGHYKHGGDE